MDAGWYGRGGIRSLHTLDVADGKYIIILSFAVSIAMSGTLCSIQYIRTTCSAPFFILGYDNMPWSFRLFGSPQKVDETPENREESDCAAEQRSGVP